jgi:hypothetical protein
MKVIRIGEGYAEVELTRRNLEVLLRKLDAGPHAASDASTSMTPRE